MRSRVKPNDAIQSLARIASAAARLMASMHYLDAAVDRHEELDHIEANLRHVREQCAPVPTEREGT